MLKYCDSCNVIGTHLVKVSWGWFVDCFAFTYTPMRVVLNAPAAD